jgi:carboxyl-terminal processing protease
MAAVAPQSRGISRTVYFLTIAFVAVVGFVAGTRDNEIIGAIAPVLGFKVETSELNLASVQQTYQQLKLNYDGTLDTTKLIEGASRGLAEAVGDPYTVYMDAKEAEEFNKSLSGEIGGGIGAAIGVRNGKPTITRVIPGNPADKAGVQAGDIIIGINDEVTEDWTSDKAAEKIRGEVGTTVKLAVLRGTDTKEFTITRQEVTDPSVQSSVEGGIGILTVRRFDKETANLARKAARSFEEQKVKGVILDLRDNGGGYLEAAQDLAGIWLKDKVVVSERVDGKETDTLKSGGETILEGVPTVVLVNGSSASASEIVAGALKDHKAALLVGEKTYGKGTVQSVIQLGGGAQLKVTIARWYTPGGKNITKEGIAPDQEVKMSADDVNAGKDPQLEAAKSQLNK